MKLPKLPAPMTAKFVYPDMSELKLSTGCLSYGSIRALPSSYLFSFRTMDVQLLPIRPSYDRYHPLLSGPSWASSTSESGCKVWDYYVQQMTGAIDVSTRIVNWCYQFNRKRNASQPCMGFIHFFPSHRRYPSRQWSRLPSC